MQSRIHPKIDSAVLPSVNHLAVAGAIKELADKVEKLEQKLNLSEYEFFD